MARGHLRQCPGAPELRKPARRGQVRALQSEGVSDHADDEVSLVGPPMILRWMQYQATVGDYDVGIRPDEMSLINAEGRRLFRSTRPLA